MKSFSDKRSERTNIEHSEAGMTLFELLIVLLILGLLATLIAPQVIGYLGRSKTNVAEAQMSSISTALELFYLDVGRYPDASEEGLTALVEAPEDLARWQGPYFGNASGLVDPWDRPYVYALQTESDGYVLTSLGRDGEIGGDGEDRDLSRN
jgi:general secretion pathway protein G